MAFNAGPQDPVWFFPTEKRLGRQDEWQSWNHDLSLHLELVGLDHAFFPPGIRGSPGARSARLLRGRPTADELHRAGNIVYFGVTTKTRHRLLGPLTRDPNPHQLWNKIRAWCGGSDPVDDDAAASSSSALLSLAKYEYSLVSIVSIRLPDFKNISAYCISFNSHRKRLQAMDCGLTDKDYIFLYIKGVQDCPDERRWVYQALKELERDPDTTLHRVEYLSRGLPQKPPSDLAQVMQRPPDMDSNPAVGLEKDSRQADRSSLAEVKHRPQEAHRSPAVEMNNPLLDVDRSRPVKIEDSEDSPAFTEKKMPAVDKTKSQADMNPPRPPQPPQEIRDLLPDRSDRPSVDSHDRGRLERRDRELAENRGRTNLDSPLRTRDSRKPGMCNHKNHRPEDCFIDHPELHWSVSGRPPRRPMDRFDSERDMGPTRTFRSKAPGTCPHTTHRPENRYLDHPELKPPGWDDFKEAGNYDSYKPSAREFAPRKSDTYDRRPSYDEEPGYRFRGAASRDQSPRGDYSRWSHARTDSRGDDRRSWDRRSRDYDTRWETSGGYNPGLPSPKVGGGAASRSSDVLLSKVPTPLYGYSIKGQAGTTSEDAASLLIDEIKATLYDSPTSAEPSISIPGASLPRDDHTRDSGNTSATASTRAGPRTDTKYLPASVRSSDMGAGGKTASSQSLMSETKNNANIGVRNVSSLPATASVQPISVTIPAGPREHGGIPRGAPVAGTSGIKVGTDKPATTVDKPHGNGAGQKTEMGGNTNLAAAQPSVKIATGVTGVADQKQTEQAPRRLGQPEEPASDRAPKGTRSNPHSVPAPPPYANQATVTATGVNSTTHTRPVAPMIVAPMAVAPIGPTTSNETTQTAVQPEDSRENRPPKRKLDEASEASEGAEPAAAAEPAPPAPKKRWSAVDLMRAYAPTTRFF